jgi:hypothetical protein
MRIERAAGGAAGRSLAAAGGGREERAMRFRVLACDYDGTIATHGQVDAVTLAALERLRASGRQLVLVTGRELDDLERVFAHLPLFERVVAENGALLYCPATRAEQRLGDPPPPAFVAALRARGVAPLSVGRVIVATREPHETAVLEAIRDLGLELQIIFNKGAVMVLPAGVDKGTGLQAALDDLGLSPHNAVGVGDAENDHAFLSRCECAVAVANALPVLKEAADLVTRGDHGAGVVELIERLIAGDLAELTPRLARHGVLLGRRDSGVEVRLAPTGGGILIAGPSGSGKSTVTAVLLERLIQRAYQVCLVDPEGDFEGLAGAITLGAAQRAPAIEAIMQVLAKPAEHAVVNLRGVPLADRPAFFAGLLPRLQALRTQTGRPHWLVVDEAQHLLPASWEQAPLALPQASERLLLVTAHPERVAPAALAAVDTVIATGAAPQQTISAFCRATGVRAPSVAPGEPAPGEVVVWERHAETPPVRVRVTPA